MQTIICPHCKKEVEISAALSEQVIEEERKKFTLELEKARNEEKSRAQKRFEEELDLKMKSLLEEKNEERERREKLIEELQKAQKEKLELERKEEEREIENQKKLQEEREKMKEELSKVVEEKAKLQVLEVQKQLEDTKKALEEAQRKSQQGSQQLQGEVLELELEELLRTAFPHDQIEAIGKGVNGADIRHIVKSPRGAVCGVILWELKRTKHWDGKWIGKLKDDLRAEKANIPVIVSQALPDEAKDGMGVIEGVWVSTSALVLPLAELLRKNLYDVAYQKAIHSNSTEKADMLFNYLTSHEFAQQVESMIEVYKGMQDQLLKEKVAYERIWKTREAQIQKIFMSTANIIGSIQGRAGNTALPIKGLDLLELESGNE